MKIIFLDIDGVLNSGRTAKAFGDIPHGFSQDDKKYFDWVAIELMKKLCHETHAQCVISSSWRINHTKEEMIAFFELPIIDCTPHNSGIIKSNSGFQLFLAKKRGDEIQEWLDSNSHLHISQYIIIDDNDETLSSQKEHFIHVSHSNGFSLEDYDKACLLLK